MKKKQTAEEKAIALLKRRGYEVTPPAPIVMFGDVYEIDGYNVVIMLHDTNDATMNDDGPWNYGGYAIEGLGARTLNDYCLEPLWMDEKDRRNGKYKYLGHVDLSKFIKRHEED